MRQRDFVLCGERTHRLKSLLFPKSGFCSIFAVFVVDFRESSFFSTVSESPPALQLRTSCALFFTETSVKKKKRVLARGRHQLGPLGSWATVVHVPSGNSFTLLASTTGIAPSALNLFDHRVKSYDRDSSSALYKCSAIQHSEKCCDHQNRNRCAQRNDHDGHAYAACMNRCYKTKKKKKKAEFFNCHFENWPLTRDSGLGWGSVGSPNA